MVKKVILFILPFFVLCIYGNKFFEDRTDRKIEKGEWQMVWSDDFDYNGLPDSTKWGYDVGGHGWGNKELQYYTENRLENARVQDGFLFIEAHKENWKKQEYTSTRLVSRGKADWLYGRFEIRAKLPSGVGTWPAIWMLPVKWDYGNGRWPDNGEIDIMEHVGYESGKIHASTHCKEYYWRKGNQKTAIITIPDAESIFHDYVLEWSREKIDVFVDDTLYFTSLNEGSGWEVWPFDKPYYLILNLAVGGVWGGLQGIDESIFPQHLVIDYVRVYKKNEDN